MYFVIVFFIQLLLFLYHAYTEKKLSEMPRILGQAALCGVVIGPPLDLFGKYLGLFSYTLGFGALYLILNGALLYGLFAANVLLMQKARLLHFCIWITVITAVFEITNLFIRLYTYSFAVPSAEYFLVAFGAPVGIAVAIAMAWHVLFRCRFVFIMKISDRKW